MTRDLARGPGSPLARLPGRDDDRRPAQPATGSPRVRRPGGPDGAARGDRPDQLISKRFAAAAPSRPGPIPPSSSLFDPVADPPVALRPGRRRGGPQEGRLDEGRRRLAPAQGQGAARRSSWSAPTRRPTRPPSRPPQAVARDWTALGLGGDPRRRSPPGDFVTGRLATGKFQVAVGDVTIGLDPDLYPLLASSQTVTGGSNVIGLQDPALDKLLVAARGPGTTRPALAAYSALQKQLAKGRYVLPLAFADESIVVRDTLDGTDRPAGRRPG